MLLVELSLGLAKESLGPFARLHLDLRGWQLFRALAVHLDHLLLALLGGGLALGLLFLRDAFLLGCLRGANNLGGGLHASDL